MNVPGALSFGSLTLSTALIQTLAEPQFPTCTHVLGCQRGRFWFGPARLRSRCGFIGSYRLVRFTSRRRAVVGAGRRGGGGHGGARTISHSVSRRRQRQGSTGLGPFPPRPPPPPPPLSCGSGGVRDSRRRGNKL